MAFFEDYGSDFDLYYRSAFPGNMPALHLHPHYEALLILDPIPTEIFVNQSRYSATPPFFVLAAPYNLHRTYFPQKEIFERFVFYFGKDMLREFAGGFAAFTDDFRRHSAIVFEFTPVMEQKIRTILAPYKPQKMSQTERKLVFLLILNTLLENADQCKVTRFHEQSPYVCRLLEYMCEHYDEPMTLDSLAEQFFVSRSKLSKDFKTHTGTSVHQFLLDIRINRAIYYIHSGTYDTVRDIAEAVGFGNSLHFYSAFKKAVGRTPLQYAKRRNIPMKALDHKNK